MSCFLKYFLLDRAPEVAVLFIQNLKIVLPPPSVPHGFWWECHWFSNCFCPAGKVILLRGIQYFFFELWCSKLTWHILVSTRLTSLLVQKMCSHFLSLDAFSLSFFEVVNLLSSSNSYSVKFKSHIVTKNLRFYCIVLRLSESSLYHFLDLSYKTFSSALSYINFSHRTFWHINLTHTWSSFLGINTSLFFP